MNLAEIIDHLDSLGLTKVCDDGGNYLVRVTPKMHISLHQMSDSYGVLKQRSALDRLMARKSADRGREWWMT